MNRLVHFIFEKSLDEIQAMNSLQGAGIVSDNALWAKDVAEAEWDAAISFLRTDAHETKT